MPWLRRVAAVLADPRFSWLAAAIGVMLMTPALTQGLELDDHLHRAWVEAGLHGHARGPWWDLFAITSGDADHNRAAMEIGASPWWTVPELRLRFLRPLAAATHWLDYAVWPEAAWWMHAQNLAWYGALVFAVGRLLHRWLGGGWVAGLATLLFAVDDAHAITVGWIAQRNALMSAVFVVLALLAHDRARRDGWRPGRYWGPLTLALALASGESAIAALGYLGAYALLVEPSLAGGDDSRGVRVRRALVALWPLVSVVVAWRLAYEGLGYGAYGSGVYVDPVREWGTFVSLLPDRLAASCLATLAWPSAETWAALPLPWTSARRGAGLAVVLLVLALSPRLRRDRGLAACLLGAAAALLPTATAAVSDRLLLLVGLGSSAALAGVVAVAVDSELRWSGRALASVLAGPVVVVHLGLAAWTLPHTILERGAEIDAHEGRSAEGMPVDEALAQQDLVLVNAPPTFVPSSMWFLPADDGRSLPRRVRTLGSTFGPVIVQRPDAQSLVLQPVGGYFGDPFTTMVRGPAHPLRVGDRVELSTWSVEILGVAHGRPTSVRVRFEAPLDDPSLRWMVWKQGRFVPFLLPPVGGVAAIPGVASVPSAPK